ncbi:hypothetical protein VQ042_07445 [Aurantimonas sp. A2-1-M11]|uniref:hypothetical protein n=1 Tax=Aurantimonas sp. A2-1-M11 TaxID=3113712 RepID=UPI002F946FDE
MASAIEQSVRRALQKGNAADPDFRLVVYEAAERAILRVQTAQPGNEAETDRKREQLIAAIEAIEAEYPAPFDHADDADPDGADVPVSADAEPGGAPQEPAEPEPQPEDGTPPAGDDRETDDTAAGMAAAPGTPDAAVPSAPAAGARPARDRWSPDYKPKRKLPWSQRSNKAVGAVIVVLLLLLVTAAIWIVLPLLPGTPQREATEAEGPTIAETIDAANADPALGGRPSADQWIDVFAGTELEKIAAQSGASASAVAGTGGRMAVQIATPAEGDGSEIGLVIGAGIVDEIAGRLTRAELTVGSPDEAPREFSVSCLFGGETVCGRQRFQVDAAEQTFVFDMEVPAAATGAARLAIDPQIGAGPNDLNVYGFRVQQID